MIININTVKNEYSRHEMRVWAHDHFGPDKWEVDGGTWTWSFGSNLEEICFEFDKEQDYIMFLLRWS